MKKIIATVLSAVMLLSCAPVSVHAQAQTASDSVTHVQAERKGASGSVASQATTLRLSGLWEGYFVFGQEKYFKFTTTSNKSFYTFYLNVRGNDDVRYGIYEDEYCTVKVTEGTANESSVNNIDLRNVKGKLSQNHTYYVKIYDGWGVPNGSYVPIALSVIERKDTIGDDGFSASALALNKEVKSTLESGKDNDYFSFKTTNEDTFYDIVIGNIGTDCEVYFDIYKDKYSSNCLKENYWAGKKSIKSVSLGKLEKNTVYYVKVRPEWYCKDIIDNAYNIKIKSKKDDISDGVSKAKQLNIAKAEKKSIQDLSDVDYYRFKTLKKSLDYTVKIKNTGTSCLLAYVYKDKDEMQKIGEAYADKGKELIISLDSLGKNKNYYIKVVPQEWSSVYGKYTITVTPKPRGFKSSSGKGIKKGIKVSMKADGTVSGYQVKYRYGSKKFTTKTYKTSKSKITKTIKGLKRNTSYQVYVRTYYTYNKKKYYSEWESVNEGWFGYNVYTK